MKSLFQLSILLAFITLTGSLSASDSDQYKLAINYVKGHDISHFETKWNLADEKEKQLIIKQQRKSFSLLFSKFIATSDYQPEMLTLLAKLSRLTPISSPYQIKLLEFIVTQKQSLMIEHFNIISSYLPKLSQEKIKYPINETNKTYIAYNIDILKVFFISELIRLQIAINKSSEQTLVLKSILDFYRQLKNLDIKVDSTRLSINGNDIDIIICLKNPSAKIMLKENKISIDINNRLELKNEKQL